MNLVNDSFVGATLSSGLSFDRASITRCSLFLLVLVSLFLFVGCETDDCVNCLELPPPVVPTGVHSISGDGVVIVQWYDISYHPYDGEYNANIDSYYIYSRDYHEGDENIADRRFTLIGEVSWNENFDLSSGLHWFEDWDAVNGYQYEYAVAAVNSAGAESALSYEFVVDAPLYHSLESVQLYDMNTYPALSGFDFSLIDEGHNSANPDFNADIEVYFVGDVPYVRATSDAVLLQDFGVFTDGVGQIVFEGVSWAPADGYSSTGVIELIEGHIYVVEISEQPSGTYYAKFGVTEIGAGFVRIIWAYQIIEGLPELSVPVETPGLVENPEIISL
mgnify:CR=1 FL=1